MSYPSHPTEESPWIVLKFGGTSVSAPGNWPTIADILRRHIDEGLKPVVVCSAMAGVSNHLEAICRRAESGDSVEEAVAEVEGGYLKLAAALSLNGRTHIDEDLDELRKLAEGARLLREASARTRARILAFGEVMLTRVAAAWLESRGFRVAWEDARKHLVCEPQPPGVSDLSRYLSARCESGWNPTLARAFEARGADVIITQGFVARDPSGDTVLLGRGGSDTSASLFGAALRARCVEIWTDVPGMFTANPHQIPQARLLRRLDYDEAEVLASMGARVLHPRCVDPVRREGIPLHVRCTTSPEVEGTVVAGSMDSHKPLVKAVAMRGQLGLITMSRPPEWQPVGFLADVTGCFKRHGISIDLIATSPSNITATVDPAASPLTEEMVTSLVDDLGRSCRPRVQMSAASVSLVGSRLRSTLHELGPMFAPFEESRVHLVVQAANDLTWTFVVDREEAEGLVKDLHAQLFERELPPAVFGPTWAELNTEPPGEGAGQSVTTLRAAG